ncbi:MAG: DUF86 domain-containing protein, partial [Deltaproteobacteria bacterium]|nr:DUF86 domain-containing protein [Deltaproteobacteria bacterium]
VVHDYEKVDPDIIVGILRKNLNDFERFRASITGYLKNMESKNNKR